MALRINVEIGNLDKLERLAQQVEFLGIASGRTAKELGKNSQAYKALQGQVANTKAYMEAMTKEMNQSASASEKIFRTLAKLNNTKLTLFGPGSGETAKHVADLEKYKVSLDKTAAAHQRGRAAYLDWATGVNKGNKYLVNATGLTYKYVAGKEAEAVATQKAAAAGNKYIANLGQMKYLKSAEAQKFNATLLAQEVALKKVSMESLAASINMTKFASASSKAEAFAMRQSLAVSKGVASAWSPKDAEKRNKANAVLIQKQKEVLKGNKALLNSNTALGSSIRGVAGATGKLWLSYGQIIPMLTAFAAASAIKGSVTGVYEAGEAFDYLTTYTLGLQDTTMTLEELQKQILQIEDVIHTPIELAEGMKEMAKAGYDLDASLDSIEDLSKFSAIGEIPLTDAIQLAVTQVKAFSDEGLKLKDAINIMSAAALNSPQGFNDLRQALTHTTELSITTRQSFADVNTAIGLLAEGGIKGSKAGTSLRTAINKLVAPSSKVRKEMDRLGVSLQVFDSSGQVKGLKEMFDGLKEVLDNMPSTLQPGFLKDLFGLRSLKAAANVIKSLEDGFDGFKQKVLDSTKGLGLVEKMFGDLATTSRIQMQIIEADINRAFVQAFDKEMMTEVLSGVRDIVTDPSFREALAFMSNVFIGVAGLTFTGISGLSKSLAGIVAIASAAGSDTLSLGDLKVGGDMDLLAEKLATDKVKQQLKGVEEEISSYYSRIENAKERHQNTLKSLSFLREEGRTEGSGYETLLKRARNQAIELEKLGDKRDELFAQRNILNEELIPPTSSEETEKAAKELDALAESTYKGKEGIQGIRSAFSDFNVLLRSYNQDNLAAGMSEVEIVQNDLNKKFEEGKERLQASGLSILEYNRQLETLRSTIFDGAAAQTAHADALKKDSAPFQQRIKDIEAYNKASDKIRASVASRGMDEQGKVMAGAIEKYQKAMIELDSIGFGPEQEQKRLSLIRERIDAIREETKAELDQLDVKERAKYLEASRKVETSVEEAKLASMKKTLYGMQKLQAEYSLEVSKFQDQAAYRDLTDADQKKYLANFKQYKKAEIFSIENVTATLEEQRDKFIELAKKSEDFTAGFKSGLMEIKKDMMTLGRFGNELAHTLNDATAQSAGTALKYFVHGLSEAKTEIARVRDQSFAAAEQTRNQATAALEEQYAAGEIAVAEYEKTKFDIQEQYNKDRLSAQDTFNNDIRQAEEQLVLDIKAIWMGALDDLLDSMSKWAVDAAFTIGEELTSSLFSGQGAGKVGEAMSKLMSGDFSGAWDQLGDIINGETGPSGAASDPIYVIPIGGGLEAQLQDIAEWTPSESEWQSTLPSLFEAGTGWDQLATDMASTFDTALEGSSWLTSAAGAAAVSSSFFDTGAGYVGAMYDGVSPFTSSTDGWMEIGDSFSDTMGMWESQQTSWWQDMKTGIADFVGGADNLSTILGTAGLGLSAYGLYGGVNKLMEGNIIGGGIQTGLSGVGTYQSAASLGLLEPGTFSGLAESVGTEVASWFATEGAAVAAEAAVTTTVNAGTQLALAEGSFGLAAADTGAGLAAGSALSMVGGMVAVAGIVTSVLKYMDTGALQIGTLTSASGRELELMSFAGSLEEAVNQLRDPAWLSQQVSNVQQTGSNTVGDMGTFESGGIYTGFSDTIRGTFKALKTDLHELAATSEGGSDQVKAITASIETLPEKFNDIYTAMELAAQAGDGLAAVGLKAGESLSSFDKFVDASVGYNAALEQSSHIMDLAAEAATGNSRAYFDLKAALTGMGLSTESAAQTANRMMAVMNEVSNSSLKIAADVVVNVETEGAVKGYSQANSSTSWESAGFALGGLIEGGSGLRDDVYAGTVNGRDILVQGGEYIIPKEQTSKYYSLLENIRADKYASGGIIGRYGVRESSEVNDEIMSYKDTGLEKALYELRDEATEVMERMREQGASLRQLTEVSEIYQGRLRETVRLTGESNRNTYASVRELIDPVPEGGLDLRSLRKPFEDAISELNAAGLPYGKVLINQLQEAQSDTIINARRQIVQDVNESWTAALSDPIRDAAQTYAKLGETFEMNKAKLESMQASLSDIVENQENYILAVQKMQDDLLAPFEDVILKDALSQQEYELHKLEERYESVRKQLVAMNGTAEDFAALDAAFDIERRDVEGVDIRDYYSDLLASGADINIAGLAQPVEPNIVVHTQVNFTATLVPEDDLLNEVALDGKIEQVSDDLAVKKARLGYSGPESMV